jgi:hypothetical protein
VLLLSGSFRLIAGAVGTDAHRRCDESCLISFSQGQPGGEGAPVRTQGCGAACRM